MTKKLIKHGNSAALVIEKPILQLLNIDMDTALEIRTDGHSLIISPITNDLDDSVVLDSLAKVNMLYGKALAKLAQ